MSGGYGIEYAVTSVCMCVCKCVWSLGAESLREQQLDSDLTWRENSGSDTLQSH